MCCARLAENTGRKSRQKSPSGHHRTTLSGCIFATKAHIDNRKKFVKQQYLLHMPPQYGELRPTSGKDQSGSWGNPCKLQRVSRLGSVTALAAGHTTNCLKNSERNISRKTMWTVGLPLPGNSLPGYATG